MVTVRPYRANDEKCSHSVPEAPGNIGGAAPNMARVHDWLLGGKDNYPADRAAGERLLARCPGARAAAKADRLFLRWAVRHLADAHGIRQFLDVGSGLPTQGHVHEVARQVAPETRTVYVDNDPEVVARAEAMLAVDPRTIVVRADVREPVRLIDEVMASGHLNFTRPIALLLVAVLHLVRDEEGPAEAVATLVAELAPGSMLVISHPLRDGRGGTARETGAGAVARTEPEIAALFAGTRLVEPGLRPVGEWLLGTGAIAGVGADDPDRPALLSVPVLCGIGRKG
ncbi:MAG: SAM-dependent methyltransferase [Actinomycetes bacterium]|jgi:hypothetical protein|nr:MAG: hypothetical protein DIU60_07910 [Actinomycetota bacterium]